MSFDQDPLGEYTSYECEVCGGNIQLNKDKKMWECDACDLQHKPIPKTALKNTVTRHTDGSLAIRDLQELPPGEATRLQCPRCGARNCRRGH